MKEVFVIDCPAVSDEVSENITQHVHASLYKSVASHGFTFAEEYFYHNGTQNANDVIYQFESTVMK